MISNVTNLSNNALAHRPLDAEVPLLGVGIVEVWSDQNLLLEARVATGRVERSEQGNYVRSQAAGGHSRRHCGAGRISDEAVRVDHRAVRRSVQEDVVERGVIADAEAGADHR